MKQFSVWDEVLKFIYDNVPRCEATEPEILVSPSLYMIMYLDMKQLNQKYLWVQNITSPRRWYSHQCLRWSTEVRAGNSSYSYTNWETIGTMEREVVSGATPPSLDQVWMWWSSGSCTYKWGNNKERVWTGIEIGCSICMSFLTSLTRICETIRNNKKWELLNKVVGDRVVVRATLRWDHLYTESL